MHKERSQILRSLAKIKNITMTSGDRAHIYLINIYMDYSYSYGIMMHAHVPHPRHADLDRGRRLHRSKELSVTRVSLHHRCWMHHVWGHCLEDNSQQQDRWNSPLRMATYLEQREVDDGTDDECPLLGPIDRTKIWSLPIDGDYLMKSQHPGGCSFVPVSYHHQKP